MDLTKRQLVVVRYVQEFLENEGRSPTLKEIAHGVGSSAVSTIHKHVQHLIDKGFLSRNHGRGNNITLVNARQTGRVDAESSWAVVDSLDSSRSVLFCGDVAAGAPLMPNSHVVPLDIPAFIHKERQGLFVLRVCGNSMMEDSILDGDLIVLQRRANYRNGDRVVILIDGEEATFKELRWDGDGVWLIPHSPDLSPRRFASERIDIQGALVGVMRSC